MPTPTIPNGEEQFFPTIYEGNGGGQRVGKFVPFTDNGTIAKSCIFNRSDSANLIRTVTSTSNRRTFTISLWFKIGITSTGGSGVGNFMWATDGVSGSEQCYLYLGNDDGLGFQMLNSAGSNILTQICNRTVEDTGSWHHVVAAIDTTQSTNTDKLKLYLDGDLQSSFSYSNYDIGTNGDCPVNQENIQMAIGETPNSNYHYDGYIAEVNFIDGTAYGPETFGLTDTSTGRWIPKALTGITYGTNGARLQFGSSSALGDDTSGNTNDFSVTNLVTGDQTTDSPTQNHATLNANPTAGTATLSEGNLKIAGTGSSVYGVRRASFLINSNDSNGYYFEAKNVGSSTDNINIGLISSQNALSASAYGGSNSYGIASRGSGGSNQYWRVLGGSTDVTTSVSHASNDVIGVAIKQGKIWFAINNTWVLSGDPANGTNSFFDMNSEASEFQIAFNVFQNNTLDVNFGQKSLSYTPPTGFSALQQDNLPTTDKGVSGLVWTKNRDATDNHQLYDSSRGKQLVWNPNDSAVESTVTDGLQKFLKGGQQIEDNDAINTAGESFVTWNWVANSGTTASNSNGSITSTVQANTTAGFSIVQYTGTGANATVGHGLSSAPEWMIIKRRDGAATSNAVYHVGQTNLSGAVYLNSNSATISSYNFWNSTAPTSSVFSIGSQSQTNHSSANMIAYCWHSVDGFSKFGSYTGNGNADGPFIYTGFKPSWIMIKRTVDSGYHWCILDNKRNPFNPADNVLKPNLSDAEDDDANMAIDLLSNGFKIRGAGSDGDNINASGKTYIYMAFAEHPFVGDGANPVTAR